MSSISPKKLLTAPCVNEAVPNGLGTHAVYVQRTYSFDTESYTGGLYLIPLNLNISGTPDLIVNNSAAESPAWLGDGVIIYVLTKNGASTLRTYDTNSRKDDPVKRFVGEIGNLKAVKIDARNNTFRIAFSTKVSPRGELLSANDREIPESLVYEALAVRIWDEWLTPNKNSIFSGILTLKNEKYEFYESPWNILNLTEELRRLESPIPWLGGPGDFSLSQKHIAFVAKDPNLNPALNTASAVYAIPFNHPESLMRISSGQAGSSSPVWSPNDKYLAYLEQRVPRHAADRISCPCKSNTRMAFGYL